MRRLRLPYDRSASPTAPQRSMRPQLEGLEARLLLYNTYGAQWAYGSRITYSFMPDGTSIGGISSALFQTLNANYPTATWEQQIEEAASIWETPTNINLALVPDGGETEGVNGNQQDDSRFGDIRIGAVPLGQGILAETFLPPPINGGTAAGDILLNSSINWQINSNYDLMTVMAHEFGHALGLADTQSQYTTAVMYDTYNGITQSLSSDDIAGIQSIYGTRQYDQFNSNGHRNSMPSTATNITSYIDGTAQIALAGLDNTTSSDSEWYQVTVPPATTVTMTVTVQSSNLSSLSPKLIVYNSALHLVNQAYAAYSFGAAISTTTTVSAGQSYYIKVLAAGGPGPVGAYGLLVNFGNQTQAPIPPPDTVVAQQPDPGAGSSASALAPIGAPSDPTGSGNSGPAPLDGPSGQPGETHSALASLGFTWTTVGSMTGWTASFDAPSFPAPVFNPVIGPTNPVPLTGSGPGPIATSSQVPGTEPSPILVSLESTSTPSQVASPVAAAPPTAVHQAVDHVLARGHFRHKPRSSRHPAKSLSPAVRRGMAVSLPRQAVPAARLLETEAVG